MKFSLHNGRRVFQNSLVIATTFATCAALQANEHEDVNVSVKAGKEHSQTASRGAMMTADKFVSKATASGKMEVQMGQLGQKQAQNQDVKKLADALVRDHTQANQRLQQIASTKNITATPDQHGDDHAKDQKKMDQLKSASGAEFDKEFVRMALKHHKKDIAEFERAQKQINDQELKSFINQTLPKLREHYQMAKTAARSVGVDEASIAADVDIDNESATGAAAGSVSGSVNTDVKDSNRIQDRPRSSLDGATDVDASGTINQNDPTYKAHSRIGDNEVTADADIDTDADVDVDADVDGEKIFQKGDGKVLGLPTSKTDGKFLGIIPNPRADNDDEIEVETERDGDLEADVDVDVDDTSVGGSGSVETGTSKKD